MLSSVSLERSAFHNSSQVTIYFDGCLPRRYNEVKQLESSEGPLLPLFGRESKDGRLDQQISAGVNWEQPNEGAE